MAELTRTFLAVALPEETRRALGRLGGELRREAPGLRWTAPELLHLTLAFLGDVPTADLDRLGEAMAEEVSRIPPFALEVRGLGAFPDPRRARVLWAGVVGEGLEALDALHRAVVRAAARAGHPPVDARFHPHVTLARSKGGRGPSPDLTALCGRHGGWAGGALPVAEVGMYASELRAGGPIYRVVRAAPLGGTSA